MEKMKINEITSKLDELCGKRDFSSILEKIEDYIMNCGNRNLEPEEQAGVFLEIHKMISELYSVIDEAHMGNT